MHFSSFGKKPFELFFISLLSFLVFSCSSPEQTKKTTDKTATIEKKERNAKTEVDAKTLVKQASKANNEIANNLLLQASDRFLFEQQPEKALFLANQLLQQPQVPNAEYQLLLISAQASFAIDEKELTAGYLNYLNSSAEKHNLTHSYDYYQLLNDIETDKKQYVTALDAYLRGFVLDSNASQEDVVFIWQNLRNFSAWQQQQLNNLNAPYANGWVSLAQIANKYAGSNAWGRKLNEWQNTNIDHPAQTIIDSLEAINPVDATPVNNIAVLLPLSGRQSAAGIAAQQGILAQYEENQSVNLVFIDTIETDFTTLNDQFIEQEIDFVIGPLLKAKVDAYIQEPTLTLPTLLLNLPAEQTILAEQQFVLSMRPEDESIQAASILSQKDYQHPIVFSHNDSTSKRIANAFIKQWQSLAGNTPQLVVYQQGKQMQTSIKDSLAVSDSQTRINTLRYKIKETLKVEARNRRDIDMIYVVGNPGQTRLLKPYIDVNTSPFAELIPVFASSRSHSNKVDSSAVRDLEGLQFTQMPWFLKSSQQNAALYSQSQSLWPKRSDSLQRIFALGYDSLSLVDKLALMKANNHIRHFGQTGTLKLGEDNVLTRSLLWGHYQKNKVSQLALE